QDHGASLRRRPRDHRGAQGPDAHGRNDPRRLTRGRGPRHPRPVPVTLRFVVTWCGRQTPWPAERAPPGVLEASEVDASLGSMPEDLSDEDRAILEFEREWWRRRTPKERAVRDRLGLSVTRYYQRLNGL